jgi:(p)ppGpp synthase/HD superfamily hydrolase
VKGDIMLIKKALDFAYQAHDGQCRKGGNIPYIVHLFDVAKYLLYEEAPEAVVIAGILHDTLEDSKTKKQDLIQFGNEVIELVGFCTEDGNTIDANDQKETWKTRKEHSIKELKTATKNQALVFLADKLSNITAIKEDQIIIGPKIWDRFNAPKEEIEWYYTSILAGLGIVNDTRMYRLFSIAVKEVF